MNTYVDKGRVTFSILFYLKKNWRTKETLAHIYARITVNGEKTAFAINRKTEIHSWDPAKGKVKSKSANADDINSYIEILRNKAYEARRTIIEQGRTLTAHEVVKVILGKQDRENTIVRLMERHNAQMESQLGVMSSYGNYKNFKTSLRYVKEFILKQYKRPDLLLSDLDLGFIQNYSLFLQTEKHCTNNGAMKQIQRLKKVINMALDLGWISKNPFRGYKIRFKKYDRVILTAEELERIEQLKDLSNKLTQARDAFLFSCYTGLAYVDMKNLTLDKLSPGIDGELWIMIRRQKTDIKARVPLLPKALKIIERYKCHPCRKNNLVMPVYSNQKINEYLKELASMAGIDKTLSFHCGRHIFATLITLSNGVPLETVSKALGHSDIRMTQVYARVVDEKIAADFSVLRTKFENTP